MKKLVICLSLLCTIVLYAQPTHRGVKPEKSEHFDKKVEFSAEQRAELKAKRIAVKLDLDQTQIEAIKTIETERITQHQAAHKNRKKNEKPSPDELFKKKTERLDRQIAYKSKMRSILKPEQYSSWEKAQIKRSKHIRRDRQSKKHRGQPTKS